MNLRVLIADDELLSRERLKRFLRTEPETELVAECTSGAEAVAAIRRQVPDVAFLDVSMPELDGFGVLQSLHGVPVPAIVFVTAYDQFALRAFEFDAVDYLLKPFDRQRFQAALRRARHRLQFEAGRPRLSTLNKSPFDGPVGTDRFAVRASGRIFFIKTAEIDWISASDNYVELHLGNKVHLLRMTITAVAQRLGPDQFARISRSVLINFNSIKQIQPKSHGDYFVVLTNGVSIKGSRNYRKALGGLLPVRARA